jgi:DNA-directed RNA polymerase specialized sigma24 family protein
MRRFDTARLLRGSSLPVRPQLLAQEVLVVLFRELPSFARQRDGAFRAWLRQIALNRILAYWRSRQKQPLAFRPALYFLCQHN